MSDLSGKTLGNFELEEKIGAGGMGEVYRARQISLDRQVAVKILPAALANDEDFCARFEREAKAAASLIHPNVIQVYEFGFADDNIPFFAMEYVEGSDLNQLLRFGQKFSWDEKADWWFQGFFQS